MNGVVGLESSGIGFVIPTINDSGDRATLYMQQQRLPVELVRACSSPPTSPPPLGACIPQRPAEVSRAHIT